MRNHDAKILKIDFRIPFKIQEYFGYSSIGSSYMYYNANGDRYFMSYEQKKSFESQYERCKIGLSDNYIRLYLDDYYCKNNEQCTKLDSQEIKIPSIKEYKSKLNFKLLLV